MDHKKHNVVITGGAGFIGSHLAERLLNRGCHVHVLDNLCGGERANLPEPCEHLTFERVTVGAPGVDAERVNRAVARADKVFHLASPIGVLRAHKQRLETASSIFRAGLQVVDACGRYQKPLVYASSSEVYGLGHSDSLSESSPLSLSVAARLSYAVSKVGIEHLVIGLAEELNTPTWIIRFFNVSGARQRPKTGLVVPAFCDAALAGEDLVVHGDGSQQRCFLHVYDAVEGILKIAACNALIGQPVNLSSDTVISMRQLARRVIALSDSDSSIRYVSHREAFGENFADVHSRIPDSSLLRVMTDWRVEHTIDQIIADCLEHLARNCVAVG